ncbi:MAG: J domain-containing protein [Candidatus Woesearchaeota archaeon]|nr:J domain-containing protein [Candidatus Woesearchaeota archaeon]
MTNITIKGHTFEAVVARDSATRRAQQYKNSIITALGKIGMTADDVVIDLEPMAIKNAPAVATWYYDGYKMYYSYKLAKRYVDNLYVVLKVIELEVIDFLAGKKPIEEFRAEFTEDDKVEELRKKARETLGVAHDVTDMDHIDKTFKDLARKHHPDMPEGNVELFKKINEAHKTLRRELR